MELVKFRKPVRLPLTKTHCVVLEEGKSYIMAQAIAKQISDIFGHDTIAMQHDFQSVYGHKQYRGEPLDGKKIAIWRTGGAGDLLFLSPSIKKLKGLYPTSTITLATSAKYLNLFDNFHYADRKFVLPFEDTLLQESDYYCIFEGIIERNKQAEKINAYDLFAEKLGVLDKLSNEEKKPIVILGDGDRIWAQSFIDKIKNKAPSKTAGIVSMQMSSSATLRTFDAEKLKEVALQLSNRGYIVLMLGGAHQVDQIDFFLKAAGEAAGIVNVADSDPSWLQSSALIERSDLVIVPDSSLAHIAAALGRPMLGLYGPFKSDVRFRYYKNAVAIDANAACPSCFAHGQLPCKWVQSGEYVVSKCFDCVDSDLVLNIALQILEKTKS